MAVLICDTVMVGVWSKLDTKTCEFFGVSDLKWGSCLVCGFKCGWEACP